MGADASRCKRVFPNTLQIDITERTVAAVGGGPQRRTRSNSTPWAIASDGMWLMAIPDQRFRGWGSRINQQVYEDAESVLHITDVPYGTKPAVGIGTAPTRT